MSKVVGGCSVSHRCGGFHQCVALWSIYLFGQLYTKAWLERRSSARPFGPVGIDGLEIVAASAGRARTRDCQQVPANAALQLVLISLRCCSANITARVLYRWLTSHHNRRAAELTDAVLHVSAHTHIYIHTLGGYTTLCLSICSTVASCSPAQLPRMTLSCVVQLELCENGLLSVPDELQQLTQVSLSHSLAVSVDVWLSHYLSLTHAISPSHSLSHSHSMLHPHYLAFSLSHPRCIAQHPTRQCLAVRSAAS